MKIKFIHFLCFTCLCKKTLLLIFFNQGLLKGDVYVYCAWQVLGIDEDNARVMVSLAVGGSAATVSQYAIKLVTKAEFDKFSKYLSKVARAFHHLHTKKR